MFKKIPLFNLLLLSLSQIFLWTLRTEASLLGDYTSSSQPIKVEQRRTVGSGSRSNCRNLPEGSVSLLVPEAEVVHQTASSTPALFLHSKVASTLPFRFTLVNPQVAEPVVEQVFSISQPGIKRLELPKSVKLKEETVYLWNVAIPCQQNSEQYQEVLVAAIKRVPVPTQVARQLELVNTNEETAAIYASHGIWYDALEFAVRERNRPEYLQQLLLGVGLVSKSESNN